MSSAVSCDPLDSLTRLETSLCSLVPSAQPEPSFQEVNKLSGWWSKLNQKSAWKAVITNMLPAQSQWEQRGIWKYLKTSNRVSIHMSASFKLPEATRVYSRLIIHRSICPSGRWLTCELQLTSGDFMHFTQFTCFSSELQWNNSSCCLFLMKKRQRTHREEQAGRQWAAEGLRSWTSCSFLTDSLPFSLSVCVRCGSNQEIRPLFSLKTFIFLFSPPFCCFWTAGQRLLLAPDSHLSTERKKRQFISFGGLIGRL